MGRLQDKVVIITGAGDGLGRVMADLFAAAGADRLMDLMAQDKKVKRGRLTFILLRDIGTAYIAPDVDAAQVRAFLAEKLDRK